MTDWVNALNGAGAAAVRLVPWALAQSTLAALVVAGLCRLSRSPEVRFWLWQAVAVKLLVLARQRWRLRALLRNAAPCSDLALIRLVAESAGRLGVRRVPAVVFAEGGGSPFVCGLDWPTLVLPRGVSTALGEQQLRQVLLHEL